MCSSRTPSRAVSAIAVVLVVIVASSIAQAAGYPTKGAPDFTLVDQRGKPFTLAHYRGRPIVLFFGMRIAPTCVRRSWPT